MRWRTTVVEINPSVITANRLWFHLPADDARLTVLQDDAARSAAVLSRTPMGRWGREGTGPGEFSTPHSVWVLPDGRVTVADRENNRVQLELRADPSRRAATDYQIATCARAP